MRTTFSLHFLGCRTNQYEIQAIRTQLEELGWREVGEQEEASLCIINTCAVTEGAESSSRNAIRACVKRHPGSRIVVTGCYTEHLPKIEGITDIFPEKEGLVQYLFPEKKIRSFSVTKFHGYTRAFIKVQDGCDNFCSYCIIPHLRGRSRSRPVAEILDEVREVVASGHREIVITGVDVGDFRYDKYTLSDLVEMIDQIDGVDRLRISSINPNQIDAKMVEVITGGKATCPSLHLVLQSGSNTVLENMGRLYTRELFIEKVEAFRKRRPDFMFTTDIIVGFPGESCRDFEETLSLVEAVQFSKVHMFPYSERPKTRAVRMSGKVASTLISKRKKRLLSLAKMVSSDVRDHFVGTEMEILTEKSQDEKWIHGQSRNGLSIMVPRNDYQANQCLRVFIEKNEPMSLVGRVL